MTIENLKIKGKRVIIRCDFNVPIKDGVILDDNRIIASLETINYVLKYASKVILLSHLGRIKTEEDKKKNSLKPVCDYLSKIINEKIAFYNYENNINELISNNKIIMFENTRFFDLDNKKESLNDDDLAKYFSSFGDVFINDAFGTCHRENASNVGISKYLPSSNGFLVKKEIEMLNKVKEHPKHPFIVIIGGAKVSDKIPLIDLLIKRVDKLIITGGMAFTFLKVNGINIGKSLIDDESIDFCKKILKDYRKKIILPEDVYVGLEFKNDSPKELKDINSISSDEMGLDIGPKTIIKYKEELKNAQTIFLNGPAGVFEFPNFSEGTKELFSILKNNNSEVIIGGGDSANAVKKLGFRFDNISTGGGASLEYIEGKKLPGIF